MAGRIRPSDEVVQANIKKWGIPQPDKEYTVLIHCTTYNHGKYIKDALEGFVMQKCSYSFCAIIIDDCSTDNNAEIIREYAEKYPDIIKPILLGENHMQRGILRDPYFEKWHQSAKYIAECEGDDYWTDPYKLQKQVAFLENHPDYGLVRTNINCLHQTDGFMEERFFGGSNMKDTHTDYILYAWFAAPCTWLYRNNFMHLLTEEKAKIAKIGGFTGDLASILTISKYSKIKYLDDVTAVYRILEKSASHFNDSQKQRSFYKRIRKTQRYFANKDSLVVRARLEWIFLCLHIRGIYKRIESLFIQK